MRNRVAMILSIAGALMMSPLAARAEGTWRYVVPPAGGSMDHPPFRALALSDQKPDDLAENVDYQSEQPRYAQLRFGTAGSTRVALVVDRRSTDDVQLYVDADRNRVIEEGDRVDGSGRLWPMPLDVALVDGEQTRFVERSVVFRLSRIGHTLQYAARGFQEGTVRLSDRTHTVRRVDGDGNGLFADARDLIWIDLDGDGRWDPLSEQFAFVPILRLARRYAVRGDPFGQQFGLELLEGSGTVKVVFSSEEWNERLLSVEIAMTGRDGSVVGLSEPDKEIELPVGDYRVSTLTLALAASDGGPPWNYVFAEHYGGQANTWHQVTKGECLSLDPVGRVALETGVPDSVHCHRGADLVVRPQIRAGDGLLAQLVYRGERGEPGARGDCRASIQLLSPDGMSVATCESGFT